MTQRTDIATSDFHDPSNLATFFAATLAETDPELSRSIEAELQRQRHQIELIASENIVSRAVLDAQGSVLTNKYAEGYPGRRYYGGCEFVDRRRSFSITAKKIGKVAIAMPIQISTCSPAKVRSRTNTAVLVVNVAMKTMPPAVDSG